MPDEALDYGDHRGRIELRETLAGYLGRGPRRAGRPVAMVITQGSASRSTCLPDPGGARRRTVAVETPSLARCGTPSRQAACTWSACRWTTTGRASMSWTGSRRTPSSLSGAPVPERPGHGGRAAASPRRVGSRARPPSSRTTTTRRTATTGCRSGRCRAGPEPRRARRHGLEDPRPRSPHRLAEPPGELVGPITVLKNLADSGSPSIEQFALATLIERGDYERHLAPGRSIGPDAIASWPRSPASARRHHARGGGGCPCRPAAARRRRRRGRVVRRRRGRDGTSSQCRRRRPFPRRIGAPPVARPAARPTPRG